MQSWRVGHDWVIKQHPGTQKCLWKSFIIGLFEGDQSSNYGESLFLFMFTSLVVQRVKHLPSMQETWVQSLGGEDPLEKEMATHSSIIAWKTPWMEKPDGLQSMELQRVGHDWVTSLSLFTFKHSIYLPHCVLNTLVIHPHLILLRIWIVGFIILFIVRYRNCITERE